MRFTTRLIGVILTMVLLAAACGSDSVGGSVEESTESPTQTSENDVEQPADDSSDTAAEATTDDAEDAPTSEVASGEPVLIGITAPTNNPLFDAAEMIQAASAAADYINAELDGIAGRPIELVTCETVNTPESVLGCAAEILAAEPLLVIPGPDFASPAALETYTTAGIPLIGGAAFAPNEFVAENRILFQGWSASLFPAMTHFAAGELGAENIVAVSFDDPQNQIILAAFMEPVMASRGLPSLEFVGTPASAPDFAAPLAVAVNADADAILAFGLPCEPIMQAYAGLGSDIPIVLPDNCTDPDVLAAVGDAAEGVYFVIQYDSPTLSPDDPETMLYTDVLAQYGEGDIRESSIGLSGFASVMNIHDVLDDSDIASLEAADVLAAFRSLEAGPNFLIDGDFNCATPPLEQFPSLCEVSALLAQYVDGELVPVTGWVGGAELWG